MFEFLLAPAIVLDSLSPLPPVEYRGNTKATVIFITNPTLVHGCGVPKGWVTRGCTFIKDKLIFMPNPCLYPEDYYASVLCHEIGHINGWVHPSIEEGYENYVKKMGPILKESNPSPVSDSPLQDIPHE